MKPPQVTPPEVTPPEVTPPEVKPPKVTPPEVTPPEVTPPEVTPPQVRRRHVRRPAPGLLRVGLLLALVAGVAAVAAPARAGTLRLEVETPAGGSSAPTSDGDTQSPSLARAVDGRGQLAGMVRAGETVELPAGRYRIELLVDPPLVREGVVVPAAGEVTVRLGLGLLRLEVRGADGEPVATAADVFLSDGRRIAGLAAGGGKLLPPGTYRVVVRTNPNRSFDAVKVQAGRAETLRLGLGASLRLVVLGPGKREVAVTGRLRHPDGSDLAVASGESLGLPPGRYAVVVDTVPPSKRVVELAPGKETVLRIDDLGEIVADFAGPDGVPLAGAVTVLDPASGLVLTAAENGAAIAIRPGVYRVRLDPAPGREAIVREGVKVAPGTRVKIGSRPGRGAGAKRG